MAKACPNRRAQQPSACGASAVLHPSRVPGRRHGYKHPYLPHPAGRTSRFFSFAGAWLLILPVVPSRWPGSNRGSVHRQRQVRWGQDHAHLDVVSVGERWRSSPRTGVSVSAPGSTCRRDPASLPTRDPRQAPASGWASSAVTRLTGLPPPKPTAARRPRTPPGAASGSTRLGPDRRHLVSDAPRRRRAGSRADHLGSSQTVIPGRSRSMLLRHAPPRQGSRQRRMAGSHMQKDLRVCGF